MEQIQISAKNLGALMLEDACDRCFYIKLHTKKLPWQIFPGIFSSIDAYTKKVFHYWIERHQSGKEVPDFIMDLDVTGFMKTPHWSKFFLELPQYGIKFTGVPDDFWILGNGRLHIPDAKTAKYTVNQDKLIPMYKIQLNGYAKIASSEAGLPEVDGLSMVYMEPQTDVKDAETRSYCDSFDMWFRPKFVPVAVDLESLDPLFEKTRQIYDGPIPESQNGCKDCEALNAVSEMLR